MTPIKVTVSSVENHHTFKIANPITVNGKKYTSISLEDVNTYTIYKNSMAPAKLELTNLILTREVTILDFKEDKNNECLVAQVRIGGTVDGDLINLKMYQIITELDKKIAKVTIA